MNVIFGLVLFIIIKKYPEALFAWIIVQLLIIVVSILNYSFYSFLLGFISPRSATVFRNMFELRAIGFGLFHVDGAVTLITAGVFYCILCENKFKKTVLGLLVLPISMSVARSAIIPFTIFGILAKGYQTRLFMLVLAYIMCILSLIITNGPFYHGLELFRNFVNLAQIKSTSIDHLTTMYIFPSFLKTYFWGDGKYYGDLTNQLNFYKSTDVGYLRLIYFSGVFSLLLFIVLNLYFLVPLLFNRKKLANFDICSLSLGLILIFIILNFKGIQMSGIFASTLYCFTLAIKENGPELGGVNKSWLKNYRIFA